MIFSWHKQHWDDICDRISSGQFPHALLLTGPKGIGKLEFARTLSELLLCDSGNDLPCGECRGCRLMAAGTHPDFRHVFPLEESKSKEIKIDQVRELTQFLSLSAQYGRHKVTLIEPADRMNRNSANSLLKTLEEPPRGSCLILVTSQPSRLPATVRSRTQQIIFSLPDRKQALEWLGSQVQGKDVNHLLNLGEFAPLESLNLADDELLAHRQALFNSLIQLLEGKNDPLTLASEWSKTEENRKFDWLASWYRDMIMLRMLGNTAVLINSDLSEKLDFISSQYESMELFEIFDKVLYIKQLQQRQANLLLTLEELFIDLAIRARKKRK